MSSNVRLSRVADPEELIQSTTQSLGKRQKAALNRASPAAVVNAAVGLRRGCLSRKKWIGARNRYRSQLLKRLEADAPLSPEPGQFAQFLAASSFHHCADGWSFLGRAIAAALVGDSDAARHLGYYAELRAALGLLASQGIGIFNGVHASIESGPKVTLFKGPGTHEMAWLALPYWARSQGATSAVASLVDPYRVPLDRWVGALPGGGFRPIAEEWLGMWGLDLEMLAFDRDARNESSYQPTRLDNQRSAPASEAAAFAVDAWTLLEPASPADPFATLDLQLTRRALETAFTGAGKGISNSTGSDWSKAVNDVITNAVGVPSPQGLRSFLLRSHPGVARDSMIFSHADGKRTIADPNHHFGVLSRALLLMRVCSGCVRTLATAAGVDAASLTFWAEALAEDRGLWSVAPLPDPVTDLYLEVAAGLQDIQQLLSATPMLASYHELRLKGAAAVTALAGCERVALWSIAA